MDFPGNYRVNSKADIPAALEALKDRPLYSEKWAYFKMVGHLPMPQGWLCSNIV